MARYGLNLLAGRDAPGVMCPRGPREQSREHPVGGLRRFPAGNTLAAARTHSRPIEDSWDELPHPNVLSSHAMNGRSSIAVLAACVSAACHPALPSDSAAAVRLGVPGVKVTAFERDYEVLGSSAADLLRSMKENSSSASFGSHNVEYRRTYTLAEAPNGCRAQSAAVEVVTWISLPKWVMQPEPVDSQLVEQWNVFVANLRSHEEAHRAIAIRIANDLVRELHRLETRTCIGWIDAAEQVMVGARRDYMVRQERYDRDQRVESQNRLRWPPRTIFDQAPPPPGDPSGDPEVPLP
jgi:predicted secreted Zn-dependent protease